ncbi:hypothetical protein vseg_006128 [Gypsophila vaccaria]
MAASGTTAMFLGSFDASGIRKDASYIVDIFFKAIDEVGASNIVQVVTDNGCNFKAAGGDNFDVDAEIFEFAELTINDPEFERLVQSLGDEDADEVGILNS